jgi:hypothetical protein
MIALDELFDVSHFLLKLPRVTLQEPLHGNPPMLRFALLLMLALPLAAAENPAGNWKLKLPTQGGKSVTFLVALSESEGKWVCDYLGTNAQAKIEPKITNVKLDGDHLTYDFQITPEVGFTFDGTIAKGGQKILGTLASGTNSPILTEMATSKLKKIADPFDLARENFEQADGGADLFENGFGIASQAAEKKLTAEDARGIADKMNKASAAYGPRWERTVSLRLANEFAPQTGFAEVALVQARRAERAMTDEDPVSLQLEILETLVKVLTKAGKPDDAKKYAVPIQKLALRDVADYAKETLKFEMPEFKGRMAKSDRVVLMELFTSSESDNAVASSIAFDALLKSFKPTDLVVVQYHFPFENAEPLSTPEGEDRIRLYQDGIQAVPGILLNGKPLQLRGAGAAGAKPTYNGLRKLIEESLEKPATAKVAVSVAKDDKGNFTAKANVSDLEKPGDKVFLRFLLVEERIRYVGGNGVRFHQNVVRAMPGGSKGVALTMKAQEVTAPILPDEIRGKLTKYLDDFAKKAEFPKPDRPMDLKNLKLIAIVQDDATGEVLNCAEVEVK